jgi:hypothetical protein
MQHESNDMTNEQRQRSNALAAANIARTGMSFDEQITMAEYIFSGRILVDVETEEFRDGSGNIIFTDTTVTDVG